MEWNFYFAEPHMQDCGISSAVKDASYKYDLEYALKPS